MQFGALRVLNDDIIAPGRGFGTHPHDNMEIITIPLEGSLKHKDSMENEGVIEKDEIQVMSAGTGVSHSEYNKSVEKSVSLLQIWIFPKEQNIAPRYDQKSLKELQKINNLYPIVTPNKNGQEMWINQDAWLHMGDFNKPTSFEYKINKNGNGVYTFVIDGCAKISDKTLQKRDALGIWDVKNFNISVNKNTKLLLIEVPV